VHIPSGPDGTSSSEPSVPPEISHVPAAMPHQARRASRGQFRQFRKPGKEPAAPSLRSSSQPTSVREAPKGPHLCNICGKLFSQRQGLGRHRREKHDAKLCKHCGDFKWARPYLLRKHLKEKHPDIDPKAVQEAGGHRFRDNHMMSTQNHGIYLQPLNTTEGTVLNPNPSTCAATSCRQETSPRLPTLRFLAGDLRPQPEFVKLPTEKTRQSNEARRFQVLNPRGACPSSGDVSD